MTARDVVLGRVRAAQAGAPAPPVVRTYDRDLGAGSVQLLVERLVDYRALVHEVTASQVPQTLAGLLAGRVVVPDGFPDELLVDLPAGTVVRDAPPLSAAELDDLDAVLTTCALAVAETGTVVLDGGPGQGRRALSLVPDRHVVVVRAEQVVASVPGALQRLRPSAPQTWISGPSATSDIELQRVEGVHGPRTLEVLVVRDDATEGDTT